MCSKEKKRKGGRERWTKRGARCKGEKNMGRETGKKRLELRDKEREREREGERGVQRGEIERSFHEEERGKETLYGEEGKSEGDKMTKKKGETRAIPSGPWLVTGEEKREKGREKEKW